MFNFTPMFVEFSKNIYFFSNTLSYTHKTVLLQDIEKQKDSQA